MKHILGLILALAMVLAVGSAALAVPAAAGEQGQWVLLGDYNTWWPGIEVGIGYAFTDTFTLGLLWEDSTDFFGGFATLSLDSFAASVAVYFDGTTGYYGKAKALYNFDLAQLRLGLGLGADFADSYDAELLVEASASLALGKQLRLFGSAEYYFDGSLFYEAGLSAAF